MTQKYTFDVEVKTTDEIERAKMERTFAKFVDRISENENVLTTDIDMSEGEDSRFTEDDIERLLRTIEQVSDEDREAAVKIAKSLSDNNE